MGEAVPAQAKLKGYLFAQRLEQSSPGARCRLEIRDLEHCQREAVGVGATKRQAGRPGNWGVPEAIDSRSVGTGPRVGEAGRRVVVRDAATGARRGDKALTGKPSRRRWASGVARSMGEGLTWPIYSGHQKGTLDRGRELGLYYNAWLSPPVTWEDFGNSGPPDCRHWYKGR